MIYNWQQKGWPDFKYELDGIEEALFSFAEKAGHISGALKAMPEEAQTSEIEGEYVSRHDVISSVRNQLGLDQHLQKVKDKRAMGLAELMVDVRNSYAEPLSCEKLFLWHQMLMGEARIRTIGAWRNHQEPMQVVSGRISREKVHFEAPPSKKVPKEMNRFIQWFNDTQPGGPREIRKAPIRSAIAHLYFESIHPFEDGNGRIGRAISEKALSQGMGYPILLSISQAIESNKKAYYQALEKAQKSLEIYEWLHYFVHMLLDAQKKTQEQVDLVIRRTRFFDRFKHQLNERQLKVVRKMIEKGSDEFKGGMSTKKYISITQTSKATATRDLQDLVKKEVLSSLGGGRSTRYQINY